MKVYEFVILLHPTDKEKEDGKESEIVVAITQVLARDESQATMLAGRAIPDEYLTKLERVEVAVRPF